MIIPSSSSASPSISISDHRTPVDLRLLLPQQEEEEEAEEKLYCHSLVTSSTTEERRAPDLNLLLNRRPQSAPRWRSTSLTATSSIFKHKFTNEVLWINGLHTSAFVQDELRLRELEPFKSSLTGAEEDLEGEEEKDEEEEEFCAKKRKKKKKKKNNNMIALEAKEIQEDIEGILDSSKNHQPRCHTSSQAHMFATVLKACAKQKDLQKGSKIHADIVKMGLLKTNVFLGSTLVSMYAKCGSLAKAQEVFDKLPVHDVVAWSALIIAYAQHGQGKQALCCFERMRLEGLSPDRVTFISILKGCGTAGAGDKGKEIHDEIVKAGLLKKDIVLGNAVVDMYVKCGLLEKAKEVFDELPVRNVVTWNTIISGYAQLGHGAHALKCFEQMQLQGIYPNMVTYVCALKSCGSVGAAGTGEDIHAEVVKKGLLKKNIVLGNALVDMYAKCSLLAKAQEVFDKLPLHNVVTWNTLIAGYAQHGQSNQVIKCFEQMQRKGFSPDAVTFVCMLKACGSIGAAEKGKELHAAIVKVGLLKKNVIVGNVLVDMYVKCGLLVKAQEVFNELPVRNVITWSALMAGFAQHGDDQQVLKCFDRMQFAGLLPDAITFIRTLKACGNIGAVEKGKEIHAQIIRQRLLVENIIVGNALLDMYVKCGLLEKAQEVFSELPVRNTVSWNTLMAGYAQEAQGQQALMCFEQMKSEGIPPDAVTYVCMLKACGSIGAASQAAFEGKRIHVQIVKDGLLKTNILLGTALVDMYARCGLMANAQEVFDEHPAHDAVSWNSLMTGYILLGDMKRVHQLFDKMIGEGIKPDAGTFSIVLNACSHNGLVEKGQLYFNSMSTDYGVSPHLEHYTCMVDLFSRAGHIDKAVELIKGMPFSPDFTIWLTVLGACRKWGNMKLGRLAFEHAVQLDARDSAAYVCMSNIYAGAGRKEDADNVEAMRLKNQAW